MKKIILATLWVALATALPNIGQTQTPDTSTIDKLQRYVAGPLDKTQVPTGFLEDYGTPFIPMAVFNGNLSDSNKIEINLLRLLYFQLHTNYCQAGTNPLPGIVTVNTALQNITLPNQPTPVPFLIEQYNNISDNAANIGLLIYNLGNFNIATKKGFKQKRTVYEHSPPNKNTHNQTNTFCKINIEI